MQFELKTSTWDLHLDESGNIAILKSEPVGPLLAQRIKHRLQTFRGECFLNRSIGVPYFSEVLKKNPDLSRIRSLLASVINRVEGVVKILSLNVLFEGKNRSLSVAFKVLGEADVVVEGEV